jgi:glucose dehydrogenase
MYDNSNGDLLWEYQMEAPGYSSPSVYEIDGKQYVVIVAGGGGPEGRVLPFRQVLAGRFMLLALPD